MEWKKLEDKEPPKDREFIARDEVGCFIARFFTKEDPHPINGQYGFYSVVCDCCDYDRSFTMKMWCEIPLTEM